MTFCLSWLLIFAPWITQGSSLPHIIYILADDLGWNDVSFHGSDQNPTPNIDALAYDGIILNNYYVQSVCSASRSALLTGKYPYHLGMQHKVIQAPEPWGLSLEEKLLPEYLQELGYVTHMVGKWHLGFYKQSQTPMRRGFDSHYGYLNSHVDYFGHYHWNTYPDPARKGHDFWNNGKEDRSVIGQYTTELFTAKAEQLIASHDQNKPLFLYLAQEAPHTGSPDQPLQVLQKYYNQLTHIKDVDTRKYAAMILALDESVGRVTKALAEAGMLNDTVIIFSSDNGASALRTPGSNLPLRGMKKTVFEGGTRAPAFVWSPLLEKSGYISNNLMHISDWLPTILSMVGYKWEKQDLSNLDGYDMWDTLSKNLLNSPRSEMVYNIDGERSALRVHNLKLLQGQQFFTEWSSKCGPDCQSFGPVPPHLLTSYIPALIEKTLGRPQHQKTQPIVVNCGNQTKENSTKCEPEKAPCLFDLSVDPCEFNNLAGVKPEVLRQMLRRLADYRNTTVPPRNLHEDSNSFPILHSWTWGPWVNETCKTHDEECSDMTL